MWFEPLLVNMTTELGRAAPATTDLRQYFLFSLLVLFFFVVLNV